MARAATSFAASSGAPEKALQTRDPAAGFSASPAPIARGDWSWSIGPTPAHSVATARFADKGKRRSGGTPRGAEPRDFGRKATLAGNSRPRGWGQQARPLTALDGYAETPGTSRFTRSFGGCDAARGSTRNRRARRIVGAC